MEGAQRAPACAGKGVVGAVTTDDALSNAVQAVTEADSVDMRALALAILRLVVEDAYTKALQALAESAGVLPRTVTVTLGGWVPPRHELDADEEE